MISVNYLSLIYHHIAFIMIEFQKVNMGGKVEVEIHTGQENKVLSMKVRGLIL